MDAVLVLYFRVYLPTRLTQCLLACLPACSIFVYIFLPPFLVDLAVRIDYFMLKKMG